MNKKTIAGMVIAGAFIASMVGAGALSVSAATTAATAATTASATAKTAQKSNVIVRPDEKSYYQSEDGGTTWKKTTDGGKTWTTVKAGDVPAARASREGGKESRDTAKAPDGKALSKIASSTTIFEDGTGIKTVGETVTYTTDSGKTWSATKPANFPEYGGMFGGARGFGGRGGALAAKPAANATT